jgi:sulfite reductase alpha subunit-like flavoprotein
MSLHCSHTHKPHGHTQTQDTTTQLASAHFSPFTQLTAHQPAATRSLTHCYTTQAQAPFTQNYTSTLHQHSSSHRQNTTSQPPSHVPNSSLRRTHPNSHITQPPFSISASGFSSAHNTAPGHYLVLTAHHGTSNHSVHESKQYIYIC